MSVAVRVVYNLVLPVVLLVAAPAWILRMARRGGLSPRLWERLGCYDRPVESEPAGVVYLHAVSVGEVLIGVRLIQKWLERDPDERFVLAATTSTGFQIACENAPERVRVIYSPVDLPFLIERAFRRFEPRLMVLVDSELWPNLMHAAKRREIPIALVNARLSARSARRYARFKAVTGSLLRELDLVCAQADEHAATWRKIGVRKDAIVIVGSPKFDPEGGTSGVKRREYQRMLDAFGGGRPVVLAASTHAGEEVMVARAASEAPGALSVILPRHAERRGEVREVLERAGFEVVLRSDFHPPHDSSKAVLVVDSTGELRDWTMLADLVVVGKSLQGGGGQNPVEAIEAGVPVICGPSMDNFEPLVSQLREAGAVWTVDGEAGLGDAIAELLGHARKRASMTRSAKRIVQRHRGATAETVKLLAELTPREAKIELSTGTGPD